MLGILGMLFSFISFGVSVVILIHAFKASTSQGLLCLCVPCYIFYYAFTKFEHEKKNLLLGVWIGAAVLGGAVQGIAAQQAAQAVMDAQQGALPAAAE